MTEKPDDLPHVDPALLAETARRLFNDEDLRPSVVMAQTAIEVATENALRLAFRVRGLADLGEPVLGLFISFSLKNKQLYRVYVAVTRDDIKTSQPDLWRDFVEHVKVRNDVVHTGRKVSNAEAERSVQVAERIVPYLDRVTQRLPNA
jgi:hypothetical protein